MKVLLLTDGITPFVIGGMQKHSAGIAKELLKAGVELTLVHCVYEGQRLPSNDEVKESLGAKNNDKLTILSFRFPKGSGMPGHYLKASYNFSFDIYQALESTLDSFDFIYAKGFTPWYFIHQKTKGRKIPPIGVKFHGYEMFQPGGTFSMRLKKWLLKGPTKWISQNADYVFSYGSKVTDLILKVGVPKKNIIEIPSGISDDWFEAKPKESVTGHRFIFIGRYERRKGIEELMEVLKQLSPQDDVTYEFIGPIPHTKRLMRSDIIYHGEVKEMNELIKILDSCNVLICPSHSEGMPNVILEAMARGLFILATDVGATNVLVIDGENGKLIKPGNRQELLSAINEILRTSPQMLTERGRVGNRFAQQKFAWSAIAAQLLEEVSKRLRNP